MARDGIREFRAAAAVLYDMVRRLSALQAEAEELRASLNRLV
jgi:hypothetical protein